MTSETRHDDDTADRRLTDTIERAIHQAVSHGRDDLAERLGICRLTVREEEASGPHHRRADD
jgi:hypothetical protein